jgi:hypothetical protein
LYWLIKHLLLPTEPPHQLPPTLTKLFLHANEIKLSDSSPVPSLLSAALSHPASRLQVLSLTGNAGLHLSKFLAHCSPTALRELHLNTCGIWEAAALTRWLCDVHGGGRIENLMLNGNYLGPRGLNRLLDMVMKGENLRILRLELAANARPSEFNQTLPESEQEPEEDELMADTLTPRLEFLALHLERNAALKRRLHRSTLSLVSKSRMLLLAQPTEEDQTTSKSKDVFPWTKLPSEIQIYILRWYSILEHRTPLVDSLSYHITGLIGRKTRADGSPLSSHQFLTVIKHCQDRRNILTPQFRQSTATDEKLALLQGLECEQWEDEVLTLYECRYGPKEM